MSNTQTRSVVSRCRARIFHFTNQDTSVEEIIGDLTDSEEISLNEKDNDILNFQYQKNNNNASGIFMMSLAPRINYKEAVKPGDWILIYLKQEESNSESLRVIGIIDRVSVNESIDQNKGTRTITYNISGRDYGKVFEKTDIWYNAYLPEAVNFDQIIKERLGGEFFGSPSDVIKALIGVFLARNELVNQTAPFISLENQWVLPNKMSSALNSRGNKFVDILDVSNIHDFQNGAKNIDPTQLINNSLWTAMKSFSNYPVNEFFVEMDDSDGVTNPRPSIFLRMLPFVDDKFQDPNGVIQSDIIRFRELPSVEIKGSDILGSDIGISEHDRLNFFLAFPVKDFISTNSAMSYLKKTDPPFPQTYRTSIKRHGLNMFKTPIDFTLEDKDNGNVFEDLLLAWNIFLSEIFKNNHHLENGTLNIIGDPSVRIGKRLVIRNAKIHNNKEFYVEGYTDTWSYPGIWEQTIEVTRGKSIQNNQESLVKDVEKGDDIFSGQSNVRRG